MSEATFSYVRGEGFVTFDTTTTSLSHIVGELERMTGYVATVRATETNE